MSKSGIPWPKQECNVQCYQIVWNGEGNLSHNYSNQRNLIYMLMLRFESKKLLFFNYLFRGKICLLSSSSRQALGPTRLVSNKYPELFFSGVKWQSRETNLLPLTIAKGQEYVDLYIQSSIRPNLPCLTIRTRHNKSLKVAVQELVFMAHPLYNTDCTCSLFSLFRATDLIAIKQVGSSFCQVITDRNQCNYNPSRCVKTSEIYSSQLHVGPYRFHYVWLSSWREPCPNILSRTSSNRKSIWYLLHVHPECAIDGSLSMSLSVFHFVSGKWCFSLLLPSPIPFLPPSSPPLSLFFYFLMPRPFFHFFLPHSFRYIFLLPYFLPFYAFSLPSLLSDSLFPLFLSYFASLSTGSSVCCVALGALFNYSTTSESIC
jgi:hypothetical protein